jgi:hypothetical protein
MPEPKYTVGDCVLITRGDWSGHGGVVSWPLSDDEPGYVLVCIEDKIAGVRILPEDVTLADRATRGFTQLTYQLNRLSSFLIEKRFL